MLVLAATFGVGALHAQEKAGVSDAAITRQIERGLARDAVPVSYTHLTLPTILRV